jgi:hypothetical protein
MLFERFVPEIKTVGCRIKLPDSGTPPANKIFHIRPDVYPIGFYGRVVIAVAGLAQPSVELGVTGDTERYMTKQRIDVVGGLFSGAAKTVEGEIALQDGYCIRMEQEMPSQEYSYHVVATFRVGSGTLSGYTAGEVEFVMAYIDAKGSNY